MKISLFVYFILFTSSLFAQPDLDIMKNNLCGTAQKRWIFSSLKKTMGEKFTPSSACNYARIIFSINELNYLADRCTDQVIEKGKWVLGRLGTENFTLKLDKIYLLDFYTKKVNNKDRLYMRLKLQGQNMQDPSFEYIYYAE